VVDARTTAQNIAIIRSYGARVEVVTEPDPVSGEFLPRRLRRVREIVAGTADAYWPNQYENPLNPGAHAQTMQEIVKALDHRVDYLFCATSSCGTLRGCADYVREHDLPTRIVAVDAMGSALFAGGGRAHRLLPGYGSSLRSALLDPGSADRVVHVSDLEAVAMCRRLVAREAVLAGGSSGAVVAALEKIGGELAPGSNCAVILPDSGERYLETVYSDAWVERNFGDVFGLWDAGVDDEWEMPC
jgi:cysteine synthase A